MEKIVLKATRRTDVKSARTLRTEGVLPAVMYGHHFASTAIALNAHEVAMKLARLSSSAIINIDLEGETHAALVRERQKDFIRNVYIHIDFQVVSLTEKIRTTVGIHLDGLAPAVKDYSGVVVTNIDKIEVEALPMNLPERIMVDVSTLTHIGDAIHVRDLVVGEGVTVLEDEGEIVVVISATKEEVEPVVAEAVEPEVIERGKKEEEEE
jgi:large subunit ribosomal protein L25